MVAEEPIRIGSYALYAGFGTGSTSTVHFGLEEGEGFARVVAVKRFVPNLATNAEFVAELSAEVQQIIRVRHLNIVGVRDIVADVGECIVVMDYVPGDTLAELLQTASVRPDPPPPAVVCAIVRDALQGLHAAHEARDAEGAPLGLVHGDASPKNILVGADGFSRVLDFGVAHALGDLSLLQRERVRGKLSYTSPERIQGMAVDARADIFTVAVTLWESLVGRRLFLGEDVAMTLERVASMEVQRPSELAPGIPRELDEVVMRGLDRDPNRRFTSAKEMAAAIKAALRPATLADVEAWMKDLASEILAQRAEAAKEIEQLAQSEVSSIAAQSQSPEDLPPVSQHGHSLDLPMGEAPPSSHRELPAPMSQPRPPQLEHPEDQPLPPESFGPSSFGPTAFAPQSEAFGAPSTSITANAIKELPPPMRDRSADSPDAMSGRRKIVLGAFILLAMYGAVYYLVVTPRDSNGASPAASLSAAAPAAAPTPSVDPFEQLAEPQPDSGPLPAPTHAKPRTPRQHLKKCDPPFVQDMSGRKVPNKSCN